MRGDADSLASKPPCLREDAVAVVRALREAGHVAYLAGGCVRDLLLGLEPKDYDVATDAPPRRVRQLFRDTQAVGQAFGVILVRLGHSVVEVATFRTDGTYLDGRRPSEVTFTDAEHDAQRRDFSINGLFLDPLDGDRVIDFVGGVEDLKARRLRAIGNPHDRFKEDHLRLLRAVRFAARFGLTLDPATSEAIRAAAPSLKLISPERIADELRRTLAPATRAAAWPLLWAHGLADVVFRFVPRPWSPDAATGRSLFLALAPGRDVTFGLALAAAALDLRLDRRASSSAAAIPPLHRKAAQATIRPLDQALKLSNVERDEAAGALEGLGILLAEPCPSVATLKRFLARPTAGGSRMLLDALEAVGLHVERACALRPHLAELEQTDFAPPPLITGDDLVAAGLTPGPAFKKALDAAYDAQLEGRVTTRDEALALAIGAARAARA